MKNNEIRVLDNKEAMPITLQKWATSYHIRFGSKQLTLTRTEAIALAKLILESEEEG